MYCNVFFFYYKKRSTYNTTHVCCAVYKEGLHICMHRTRCESFIRGFINYILKIKWVWLFYVYTCFSVYCKIGISTYKWGFNERRKKNRATDVSAREK